MSKLTDKISYLQGLAEGMKLNPEKDSHRLILGILDVLGDVGVAFEALAEAHGELAEAHGELSNYVESIDEDLADLEADLFDEDGDLDRKGFSTENAEEEEYTLIEYECPHCGKVIEIEPDAVDFDEDACCPACGKPLFPELPEEGKAPENGSEETKD